MAISYAGQELLLPVDHDWNNACKWVEAHIRPDQIYEAYFNLGEEKPWKWYSWPPRVRPGELVWPNDASRWAYGHFFAGKAEVDNILATTSGHGHANLVMSGIVATGGATDDSITAQMFMLPPCPILQFTGKEPCYLLTLVDQRFFWWQYSTILTPWVEGVKTWAQIFTDLWNSVSAAGLVSNGNTLNQDTVSANYLKPARSMESLRLPIPPVLDQAAYSVGQRVVCDLNGQVNIIHPTSCRTRHDANATKWAASGPLTGGRYQWNSGGPDIHTNTLGFLPSKVSVCFPTMQDDWPVDAETEYLVDISAATNPAEVRSITGSGAYYPIHSTCPAWFLGAVTPAFNDTELTNLSNQIAADFYGFQLGYLDAQDSGIISLTPDGLNDRIEWLYNYKYFSTHIVRGTYTPPKHWVYHASAKFSNSLGYFSLKRLRNANMYYPGKEQWKITERPKDDTTTFTGSAVNNYKIDQTTYSTPTSNIDWIRIVPTAVGSTLTGVQDGFDGKTIKITMSTYDLTLKDTSASSSTGNKIKTPDGKDYTVLPGKSVMLKYAGVVGVGFWYVIDFANCCNIENARDANVGSGTLNDYALGFNDVAWLRWTNTGPLTLTGFTGGLDGRIIEVTNNGSDIITVKNATGSSSINQILTPLTTDYILQVADTAWFKYQAGSTNKWLVLKQPSAQKGLPDELSDSASVGSRIDDYALPSDNTSWLQVASSVDVDFTGMQNGRDGRLVEITNTGTKVVSLTSSDGHSGSSNQFFDLAPVERSWDILPGNSAWVKYDGSLNRWTFLKPVSQVIGQRYEAAGGQVFVNGGAGATVTIGTPDIANNVDTSTTANGLTATTGGIYHITASLSGFWTNNNVITIPTGTFWTLANPTFADAHSPNTLAAGGTTEPDTYSVAYDTLLVKGAGIQCKFANNSPNPVLTTFTTTWAVLTMNRLDRVN